MAKFQDTFAHLVAPAGNDLEPNIGRLVKFITPKGNEARKAFADKHGRAALKDTYKIAGTQLNYAGLLCYRIQGLDGSPSSLFGRCATPDLLRFVKAPRIQP